MPGKVCKFRVSSLNFCLLCFQANADHFHGVKFHGHKTSLLALQVAFHG